jgi:Mg2+ and Co2+ transporter CorA
MIVNSFEINDALQLTPLSAEAVAEACQSMDARIWLDLQDVETSELQAWLDKLGIIGLARRLCLEAWDRPGFYPLKSEIIMVIPVMADPAISQDVGYTTFLCRENLLLTVHRTRFLDPQRFIDEIQDSESWLAERSIAGLVAAIMIDLSQDGLRHTTTLRNSIRILEERMDREPDTVKAEEILEVRSELLTLGAVVSDQLPALQALRATDKPLF